MFETENSLFEMEFVRNGELLHSIKSCIHSIKYVYIQVGFVRNGELLHVNTVYDLPETPLRFIASLYDTGAELIITDPEEARANLGVCVCVCVCARARACVCVYIHYMHVCMHICNI